MDNETLAEIDARFTDLALDKSFSGVLALSQAGELLHTNAAGWAHRGWQVPNTPETRFRLASVSKLFTATAVLQLVEQDKLGLEQPILPLLELQGSRISPAVTISHLLSMTSGIADWLEESEDEQAVWQALVRSHPVSLLRSNRDYLPLFVDQPANFAAGERFAYNNAGYILLALAVEQVSGLDYAAYVQKYIFDLAGMPAAGFDDLDDLNPQTAEGYLPVPAGQGTPPGWKKNLYAVPPGPAGDGSATASAEDLLHFMRALRSGLLLSPDMLALMTAPLVFESKTAGGRQFYYSLGCELLLDEQGKLLRWGKGGEEEGVSCRLAHLPEHDLDVVILGNQSSCAGPLQRSLEDLLLKP